jgi:hypothetical protein
LANVLLAAALAQATLRGAKAQAFPDPGFGDPTRLTSDDVASPPTGLPARPNVTINYGPIGPNQPLAPVRPPGWPGGNQARPQTGIAGGGPRVATALPSVSAAAKKSPADPPYDPAEIMARVGSERIQACEVLPMINRVINEAVAKDKDFLKLPEETRRAEILKIQRKYMKQAIEEIVGTKLLVSELRSEADKKVLDENEKKLRDHFNSDYLKHLQKEYKASSIPDLEARLRDLGGSIESQRTLFVEQFLAQGWLSREVKKEDKQPTHDQMLAYYREHATEWDTPAKVRWEQLTAKYTNFESRDEARAAIARWGNDIVVRRVPFAEVAKAHSQDYAAGDGGVHDWAGQGSLRSAALEEALFNLPVGTLSRILEDDEGCHIVRALERQEARRAPFNEVQAEIRQRLNDGGEKKRRAEYIEKLRAKTPVWTVFDDEAQAQGTSNGGATIVR